MIIRLIGAVILFSTVVFGNTYYIDHSGGADTNPGTSRLAPWKRCPGMNGFSAMYSHVPGDVYLFKGGVVWPAAALPLTIAGSGTSGNTDTYSADRSWFSGSAWVQPTFDGGLFGKTLLFVSGVNHVKIDDLRFINAGMVTANDIIGVQCINSSYIELSNNTFALESWGCLYISAEKSGDYNDILVHHNDISRCAFAMRFVPAAPSAIMHNVQVYNNAIHDFHSQLSGSVHGDGIQHYCSPDNASSYDRYIDGFKIFNNRFFGDFSQVSGSGGAMTALIYLSGASTGVQVYNNLFTPQFSGSQTPNFLESFISLRDNPNRGGHHRIYNNTFVTPVAGGQAAAILEDDTRYPAPGLDIRNNIFSNFNWPFDLSSTDHTIDNNDSRFIRDIGKWAGNFVGTFAKWQALGLDIHGTDAAPEFVSSTDYHLAKTSPCIGKGADLSGIFATDIDGNARGTSGFSLGAYEYGAAAQLPVVPPAPALAIPAIGATGVATAPVLSWNAVAGAGSYTLQIATSADFAASIVNESGITTNTYKVSGLANNTAYYWRVSAANANGTSSWSSAGNFTTEAAASPTLHLWWPGNNAKNIVANPSLTWSPDSGALSYSLQVSTDAGFDTTLLDKSGITANTFEVNGLTTATAYFWRVCVTKNNGTSGWSPNAAFTVGNIPANDPTRVADAAMLAVPKVLDIFSCRNGIVQVSLPFSGSYHLSIFALGGQKEYSFTETAGSAGRNAVPLKTRTIPKGFHVMRLSVKGAEVSRKICIVD